MKYYLATTGISEIWDLNSKLLILGPWCITAEKNKKLLDNKEYVCVPSPWKPSHKIKEAADYCYQVYEELLPQFSDGLNSIHNVTYPVRYWQVLIGHWLLHFIEALYDRYKRIKNALDLFPGLYTHVLPEEKCTLSSYNTRDFLNCTTKDDYYNHKLFSLVAYDLCQKNILRNDYKSESIKHITRSNWKGRLLKRLIKSLDLYYNSPITLSEMYHLKLPDEFFLKMEIGLSRISFTDFYPMKEASLLHNCSYKFRYALKLKGASDRFQSLLYKMIPGAVPMCFMENYQSYRKNIKNEGFAQIVGSAVGWFFNEEFKFFAADAVSKGAYLIDFQHGGGYGHSLTLPVETISLEKDMFFTWGWNSKKHNEIKPLPSPHLYRLKDIHSPRHDKFLFIGTVNPRYHFRFHTYLQPDDMPKYFEDKKVFFQALPDKIKKKTLYRPYQTDYGWGEIKAIKKVCPNAKYVLKGKLVSWMKKVKLVVIDHPHTSYIEALTINVPCIFYWDHDVYLMRSGAQGYFDALLKAGIHYKTPEDAGKKLIEVFEDPIGWWRTKEVQDARNTFLERFGYSRKNWLKIWTEELEQILGSV